MEPDAQVLDASCMRLSARGPCANVESPSRAEDPSLVQWPAKARRERNSFDLGHLNCQS
jgi:hypothetical protein